MAWLRLAACAAAWLAWRRRRGAATIPLSTGIGGMALKMASVAKYQMAMTCDAHGKSNGENDISGGNVVANASALRWATSARLNANAWRRATGDAPVWRRMTARREQLSI
jgi:hypothetical protein